MIAECVELIKVARYSFLTLIQTHLTYFGGNTFSVRPPMSFRHFQAIISIASGPILPIFSLTEA